METTTSPISKQKTALVVDDSKLARYVLKEMLIDLSIKVETAESAEEALGSLSAFRPDVIFMDHMMPGMDGFQAVQAIKNDPKTATIPILMYTSKDDGMYVSQARALGAVGVLPKKLKPVQLEKVLIQLRLVPDKNPKPIAVKPSVKEVKAIATKVAPDTLEELARSASEEQEKDSMRLLFRKLFSEQRDSIKQDQWQLVTAMAEQITPTVLATRNKITKWQLVALTGLFIFLMSILFMLYGLVNDGDLQQQKLQNQINEQNNILLGLQQSVKTALLNQQKSVDDSTQAINIKPIEWAINQNSQLPIYQTLSSIDTQSYITQLINQLYDSGFSGSLYIQFHSGRFCQQASKDGQQTLVNAEKSVSQCEFNLQSINSLSVIADFEYFLTNISQDFSNINVVFESIGMELTLQDYPVASEEITAGQWNQIAQKNNRFNYVLVNEG
jgi:CheY-like chemotaxis protein